MKNQMKDHPNEARQKLAKLIEGIQFAMLTTIRSDGGLRSFPMATQQVEFDGDLWFLTGENSRKIGEMKDHSNVNVNYSDPKNQRYVSVTGKAEAIKDQDKIKELWNPAFIAWFPKGLNDPNLTAIRVNVEDAEYWDSPSSAMVHLVGLAKAFATGKPSQGEPSDHKKLDLTG